MSRMFAPFHKSAVASFLTLVLAVGAAEDLNGCHPAPRPTPEPHRDGLPVHPYNPGSVPEEPLTNYKMQTQTQTTTEGRNEVRELCAPLNDLGELRIVQHSAQLCQQRRAGNEHEPIVAYGITVVKMSL